MDADALAALDEAVRLQTRLSIRPADPIGQAVLKLGEDAEVPSEVLQPFTDPDVRILRRDMFAGEVAFVLMRRDGALRVGKRRLKPEAYWALTRHGDVIRGAPHWIAKKPDALDTAAAMDAEPVQPVVHGSIVTRVWDSFIVAIAMAEYAARRGMRQIIVDPHPKRCIVDPHVPLRHVGVDCLPVPDNAAAVGHLVRALPREQPLEALRALAQRVLPAPEPDARDVYISLELEKKQWLEQAAALADAINALIDAGRVPDRIVVNGMTASFDARPGDVPPKRYNAVRNAEEALMSEISARLTRPLPMDWLYGKRFFDKAERMRRVGFFMAPGASAALIANTMGIPGVSYGNSRRLKWSLWPDGPKTARLPRDMVEDRFDPEANGVVPRRNRKVGKPMRTVGYSIDPGTFSQFARSHAEAVEALKPC